MPTPESAPDDGTAAFAPSGRDDNTASAANTGAGAGAAAPAPADQPPLAPPQAADELGRLGGYRVLAVLGRGGMGVVYRAEDPALKRQVALKAMLPRVAADPRAAARFLREARAQAAVEHDHVAAVFQVGEDRGVPFLAMPLLKGASLADALKANPRPPLPAVVRIGREVAEGLAAAHATGLVHRDVKPANVWLETPRLRVKLLDFGLARAAGEADPGGDGEPLTDFGAVVGTPQYMSPEQARGDALDPRTDLFSLGVVLYQMLTGERPFAGKGTGAVLVAVISHHPTGLATLAPPLPPALNALVTRLLAKDPAGRPATAAEVAAELGRIEYALAVTAAVPVALPDVPADAGPNPFADLDPTQTVVEEEVVHTPPPPAAPPRRRGVWVAAAVAGAVAVLTAAAAGFYLLAAPKAVLTVLAEKDDWEVVVRQNGAAVRGPTTERRFELPPGEYAVEPADAKLKARVKVQPDRVALARGEAATVSLWLPDDSRPKPPPAPAPVPTPTPTPAPAPITAEGRKALEWVLSAGGTVEVSAGGAATTIKAGGALPKGEFAVVGIGLHDRAGVTDADLENLRAVPLVAKWVELKATGITDAGLAKLVGFPGVARATHLGLGACKVTDAALAHAAALRGLTYLELSGTGVTDAGLAHLRGLKLEYLSLHGCAGVTDAGMEHLADMTTLKNLCLFYTAVTDAGFARLTRLVDLVHLHPGRVTDAAVPLLIQYPKLQHLHLANAGITDAGVKALAAAPAVTNLTLTNTKATDAALAHLPDFPALRWADVSDNPGVTDAGLAHLARCRHLGGVGVTKSAVTEAGLAAFAATRPGVRVDWDGGVIEPKAPAEYVRPAVARLLAAGVSVRVGRADDLVTGRDIKTVGELQADDRVRGLGFGARFLSAEPGHAGRAALAALPLDAAHAAGITATLSAGPASPADLRALAALPWGPAATGMNFSFDVADTSIVPELARFPAVRSVAFNRTTGVPGSVIREVLAAAPGLTRLDLVGVAPTPADLAPVAGSKLATLNLNGTPAVTDATLAGFAGAYRLTHLNLSGTAVTKAGAEALVAALPRCKVVLADDLSVGPVPQPEVERAAAEALLPHLGSIRLNRPDGTPLSLVPFDQKLPVEPFVVRGIGFYRQKGERLPAGFASEKLIPVLGRLSALEQVTDNNSRLSVTPDDLDRLAALPRAPQFTTLILNACPLTARTLDTLRRFPSLNRLGLDGTGADPDLLPRLCREQPRLVELSLSNLPAITDEGADGLLRLPLEELFLNNLGAYPASFPRRLGELPRLTSLQFLGNRLGDAGATELGRCRKMETLRLGNNGITDAGLEKLAGATALRALYVDRNPVTKAGVEALAAALPRCRIEWDGGAVEPKAQAEIERAVAAALLPHAGSIGLNRPDGTALPSVPWDGALPAEPFVVRSVSFYRSGGPKLPPDFFAATLYPKLASLTALEWVEDVGGRVAVGPEDLERSADLPWKSERRYVTFGACPLTPRTLDALGRFRRVAHVGFDGTGADAALVVRLCREHPGITQLTLTGLPTLTGEAAAAVCRLPLEGLFLNHIGAPDPALPRALAGMPRLTSLQYIGNGLDDAGAAELARCSVLEVLRLNDNRVTDAGLAKLAGLPALRILALRTNPVTKAGIDALAAALPRCRVEWDGGVIEPRVK